MSERKVLNKYYPPDYDPSKVPRIKGKKKPNDVRMMAPFNMKCNTCGNYIASATKFNAKKETVEDKKYNGLTVYRFYIRCPRCMAVIVFRTNPKNAAYEVERGATENFMALKMAERQALEEAEAEEEEEKINPMKHLESRTKASKRQMEASEQIQNLRSLKASHHQVDLDRLIRDKQLESAEEQEAEHLLRIAALKGKAIKDLETTHQKTPKTQQSTKPSGSSALDRLKKKIKR